MDTAILLQCCRCGSSFIDDVRVTVCPACGHNHFTQPEPTVMKCDFCSAPNPGHTFDVEDFENMRLERGESLGSLSIMSRGAWMACDTCAELVERDDRETLLERSLRLFVDVDLADRPIVREEIRMLHNNFFAGRKKA